ncbi:DUF4153 domain-containing protein [Pedobacter immunditicola]|uniref:DUF4153 domain-containing protein n=1 Tax=Pedobacter immunditicola TaxID=3133440 RepID=UPI00309A3920
MKFPSLASLWNDTQKVLLRFPLQVLVTILAIVVIFILADFKGNQAVEHNLIKLVLICNMALVLLLAADLFAEVHQIGGVRKWGLRLLCLLICTAFYFILRPHLYMADMFRIGLLIFSFHLMVAFSPFIKKGNLHGFWEYNKVLFLRILTAGLYAAVLFAGLSIALLAIDGLFNVKIQSPVYLRLLSVVGVGFTTVFFLAGVPVDFTSINNTQHTYPKGLKIFTQYVLIPLLTIYLLILLVYEAKILVSWELPKGLVSTLILGYAVFGVLSLLLVYPIKEQEGNGWIKYFSRWFYIMMIPLVILLLLAVWKRVDNYGITEPRYILIILALWLSIITAYFLISAKDNIKIIPISLCILALLATYGPQSAFSVSRYSQTQRLKKLMSGKDAYAMREKPEVIRYLALNHGLASLQPFAKVDLEQLSDNLDQDTRLAAQHAYQRERILVDTAYALLKIDKAAVKHRRFLQVKAQEEGVVNTKGFDYVIPVQAHITNFEGMLDGVPLKIVKMQDNKLSVKIADEPLLIFDTKPAVIAAKNSAVFPADGIRIKTTANGRELTLLITELTVSYGSEQQENLSYQGYLLVKIK